MNPEMPRPEGNYRSRHQSDRKIAISGIFVGLFLLVGSISVAIERAYWHHKGFVQGRFSAGAIESVRKRVLQAPPSAESIGKIADYVFRRLSADADLLKDCWFNVFELLIMGTVVAVCLVYVSVKLKRSAESLRAYEEGENAHICPK